MAMSLIRSLSATVIRNVSALKRDAKRLQKNSQDVFGTQYPLSTCQRALAVSRGFRSLEDVERLAQRLGMDRNAPFYTIHSRTDAHEMVLSALYRLQLDYTEGKPVVVLGEQAHAVLPALVLFLEQMSFKKRPGLILIETEAASCQDTVVHGAIEKLGVHEIVEGFRSLDLRDPNLPVSLSTTSRRWADLICSVLPVDLAERLEYNGWRMALEVSAEEHARGRRQIFGSKDFPTIPFYEVKEAVGYLSHVRCWPEWISDARQFQIREIGSAPPVLDPADREAVMDVVRKLAARNFSDGVTGESESRWRPFVALFSRHDPASEVLAGVLHSYFSWRDVSDRDRRAPILYVSDSATPYAPRFLSHGDHTAVVNGLTEIPSGDGLGEFYGYKNALRAVAGAGGLQFMGTRVSMS